MFSFLRKQEDHDSETFDSVASGMRKIYKKQIEAYKFHEFHQPALEDADFYSKPMILLVGQYSTGKTTFIKYLLETDFPGIRIGPEPTTDRFIAVMHDEHEGVVPGNALVVDTQKPFRPLSRFGNAFLNRFQCSTLNNEVLKSISIIDTPGILREAAVDRGYSMNEVIEWFAARVDRIVLLFDAHKLDISDEFKAVIESMKGYEDKIRIVLNKADMIDSQQLMRARCCTPRGGPGVHRQFLERAAEVRDQQAPVRAGGAGPSLPRNATLRKLNDLIKRARLAKTHAYIIAALRKEMPSVFGKDNKKKQLIRDLQQIYTNGAQHQPGGPANLARMQQALEHADFSKFQPLKERLINTVDAMLSDDIAKLMQQIP
uniref:Dynamin-type G domain-containing protein n=1 Tax=Macrostomum lignano TaxID=282301 RepID=A0A1I8F247_9PLAT